MTALLFALSVWFGVTAVGRRRLDPGRYLAESPRLSRRGSILISRTVVVGAALGVIAALAEPDVSPMTAGIFGGLAGEVAHRTNARGISHRRARRVLHELPVMADMLALHVRAGASVQSALYSVVASTSGEVRDRLERACCHPKGLTAGLAAIASESSTSEERRLFDLLAHSHRGGGRLADSLSDLARDQRDSLMAALTAEGGRRALATYGPILALMIPVTLVFLMYPTLSGLTALSAP